MHYIILRANVFEYIHTIICTLIKGVFTSGVPDVSLFTFNYFFIILFLQSILIFKLKNYRSSIKKYFF